MRRLFGETTEKLGRPNILVNNAGVYNFAPLEAVTEEDFHRQFNTNVLGAILATQEAVNEGRRRRARSGNCADSAIRFERRIHRVGADCAS